MENTNILLILFLLLANAFFSTAEFSIASSRRIKLLQLEKDGDDNAKKVLELLEKPEIFITVIQIGLNMVAIFAGIFGEKSLVPIFESYFIMFGIKINIANYLALFSSVLLITSLFIIVGELIPKRIAYDNPELVACKSVNTLIFILKICKPLVFILSSSANLILNLFGVKAKRNDEITFEEVSAVINEGAETGLLEKNEHKIIENVLSLTDRNILSAMRVKGDIIYLDVNDSQDEIVSKLLRHPHARFIVCDTALDNLIGYIDSRDILKTILSNKPMVFNRETLKEQGLKTILTLPDSISLLEVLDKFRETRQDIACVFNEFGMLVGLITLNDVLSTLMGNVVSSIEENQNIVKRDDNSWLIDGKATVGEVKDLFGWVEDLENETSYETISGFLMYKMKCIPKKAQKIEINNVVFEILDVDGYRIDEIMATKKIKG